VFGRVSTRGSQRLGRTLKPIYGAVATAVVAYLALTAIAVWAYDVQSKSAESEAHIHLSHVADGNAALMRYWFAESESDIVSLSTTSRVRTEFEDYLAGGKDSVDWLTMRLEAERNSRNYVNITLFDSLGKAQLAFGPGSPGHEHEIAEYAAEAAEMESGVLSASHAAPNGEYHVAWFAPLRVGADEPGGARTTGVVMYESDLKRYLQQVIAPVNDPWPTTISLFISGPGGDYQASTIDHFNFALSTDSSREPDVIGERTNVVGSDVVASAYTSRQEVTDSLRWERNTIAAADIAVLLTFVAFILFYARSERSRQKEQQAKEQIAEALETQDRFLANMSHDLRTPLNSILGFSSMMRTGMTGPLNEEQQRQVTMIESSGRHLLALVTDVLELSKMRAGREELDPETFLVSDLVDFATDVLAPQVAEKHLTWDTTVPEGLEITTDRRLAERVLLNLCGNAVKFTVNGGVDIVVSRRADGATWIAVHDTGPGLEYGTHREIMREFSQLHRPGTVKPEGSGLGLAICSTTAELLGGSIDVNSVPGHGATFTFVLPPNGDVS